jgi:hypothetical protein
MILSILCDIVAPVFVLVGLGFLLDRRLRFDMKTLGDLNFYAFVPALVFLKIVEADIALGTMGTIGGFCVVHLLTMYVLGRGVYAVLPDCRRRQTVLSLGTMFYNAGNYGIPLILLAFGQEQLEVIAVILVVQNFLGFTVGIALLERDRHPGRMLANLARNPTILAILLALALKMVRFDLGSVGILAKPTTFLADGLIPVALLTLGAQLSRARPSALKVPLAVLTTLRLVVSPLVAAALVPLFGFAPPVSSILIVAAGLPVAVNVAILAGVYRTDEDLASQSVFWTTILSAATISALLLLVR